MEAVGQPGVGPVGAGGEGVDHPRFGGPLPFIVVVPAEEVVLRQAVLKGALYLVVYEHPRREYTAYSGRKLGM